MLLLEVLIVPLFAAAALAYGQFTSGVDLVEVYATVTDASGQPVEGLTADDFRVEEDARPQAITAFAAGEVPLALAIALDRSFSMKTSRVDRFGMAKRAARTLVDALRPPDLVTIVAVGSEVDVVSPLSADHAAAARAIDALDLWGTTPLYDAAVKAVDAIQAARGRRALVLLSDGVDRDSETSAAQLVDAVRHRDVLVYPVAVGAPRPPIFAELATATGGRSVAAESASALDAAVRAIAHDLRSQYLIGYARPPGAAGSKPSWHAIDVRVTRPGLQVRARDGYFSP